MAVNRLVSIKVPVLNAIQDMGLDITKDVPTITRWIADAEREIGSYYSYKRKCEVLKVKGCCIETPCDASFIQCVVLGDYREDHDFFRKMFSGDGSIVGADYLNTFLIIDKPGPGQEHFHGKIKWEVQQGNIILGMPLDGQDVTIQYLGFSVDDEGFPMVMENHLEALAEFVMYKYCVRSRFSPNKMDHTDVQMHWKEWMRLASHSRADDGELSQADRDSIVAMIHNPYGGYGMPVGLTKAYIF